MFIDIGHEVQIEEVGCTANPTAVRGFRRLQAGVVGRMGYSRVRATDALPIAAVPHHDLSMEDAKLAMSGGGKEGESR